MGGNALKNCNTRRYEAHEYYPLEASLLEKLRLDFPGRKIEAIQAYRSKTSFGDMDILFQSDNLTVLLKDYLEKALAPKEIAQNSNVYSFEHKEFQVDLILTPEEQFDTSLNYFSYNDLGNLLGRIAHAMGLKLGHNGLIYAWRDGTHMFAEIVIERDWKIILPALGYDYDRWTKGFDNLQEIFEYVVTSRFFNREIFLLHNRNHTSRVRDAKRKTYTEFLQWLENAEEGTLPAHVMYEDKREWLPYLFEQLPGFEEKYRVTQKQFEDSVTANQRFNGELVQSITGRTQKELGNLMATLREHFGGKSGIKQWVLASTDEEVRATVLEFNARL